MRLPLRAWIFIDQTSHRLHLPKPIRYWICNRLDAACLPREDEETDDGA
jgi:hypothetical protein